jgi:hypothetical protein
VWGRRGMFPYGSLDARLGERCGKKTLHIPASLTPSMTWLWDASVLATEVADLQVFQAL